MISGSIAIPIYLADESVWMESSAAFALFPSYRLPALKSGKRREFARSLRIDRFLLPLSLPLRFYFHHRSPVFQLSKSPRLFLSVFPARRGYKRLALTAFTLTNVPERSLRCNSFLSYSLVLSFTPTSPISQKVL